MYIPDSFCVCCTSLILSSNQFECEALKLDAATGLGVSSFDLPEASALRAMGADLAATFDLSYNLMEPTVESIKGGSTKENAVLVVPGKCHAPAQLPSCF